MSVLYNKKKLEEENKQHWIKMKTAVPKIDDSAPDLKAQSYVKGATLAGYLGVLDRVEAENRALIQAINRIYRTKGGVDCSGPIVHYSSNYRSRVFESFKIEKENKDYYQLLRTSASKYSKDDQLEDFKIKQKNMIILSKYPEFYKAEMMDPLEKWSICPKEDELPEGIRSVPSKRVMCYLDFEIPGERKLGRMHIELYRDFVPIAAENLMYFLKGEDGKGYRGSQVYHIRPKFGMVAGDVEGRNGASVMTAFGRPFAHENYLLKFAGPGVVSMFTLFPGLNFCQFFISFKELPFLQNQFVVIGRVVKNLRTLEMIEEFGTASGIPKKKIFVSDCGIITTKRRRTK